MIRIIAVCVCALFLSAGFVAAEDGPGQSFNGFNLQGYTDTGEKSWDVKGDTADVAGSKITLSNVDANMYGEEKVNVTAQTGEVDQASGNMRLERDVTITSEKGSQLTTDSLQWDRQNDMVSTDADVVITDEQFTATGTGIQAQPGLKNAQIRKDVTVRVDTKQEGVSATGKFVTITSDGPMTIDQTKSMATFQENVVAFQEDKILRADEIKVFFDADMKTIQRMVCSGNVEIEQGENRTFAQTAVYDVLTKKLTFMGRPKLILQTEGENAFTATGD